MRLNIYSPLPFQPPPLHWIIMDIIELLYQFFLGQYRKIKKAFLPKIYRATQVAPTH